MKINVREGTDPAAPKKIVEVKLSSTSVISILLACILGLSLIPIIASCFAIGIIFVGGISILLGLLFGLLVIYEKIERIVSSAWRKIKLKFHGSSSTKKKQRLCECGHKHEVFPDVGSSPGPREHHQVL